MKPLPRPNRILVRGVNWVGDAVMSMPALQALVRAFPQARIDVLARPWVAELYAMQPGVNQVLIIDEKDQHKGINGLRKLVKDLRAQSYDWAVLLQNAFKAAALAFAAGIPVRLGYNRDGRRFLLTHPVPCPPQIRRVHETAYYLNILFQTGLAPRPEARGQEPRLALSPQAEQWAEDFLRHNGVDSQKLLGVSPGATFGPAKCWPAEHFAAAADALAAEHDMAVLIFGSQQEGVVAGEVKKGLKGALKVIDLCGRTGLAQALALLARLNLLLSNDSGLMHASAALGTPTLAIFGSTNPVTTSPLGPRVRILRKPFECSPCLKPICPRGDMRCFQAITPQEVVAAANGLLA